MGIAPAESVEGFPQLFPCVTPVFMVLSEVYFLGSWRTQNLCKHAVHFNH